MSMMVCVPAFAAENEKDVKNSGDSSPLTTNISKSDASLLAKQCIQNSIATDEHCSWTNHTTIEKVIPIYDLSQQVGYYLFQLDSGYVFVSACKKIPKVVAYSYDANFIADNMLKHSNSIITNDDKIVYAGGLNFFKLRDGLYKKLDTDRVVDKNYISNMKLNYNVVIGKKNDTRAQKNLSKLKTFRNGKSFTSLSSDEPYTIPHLWDDNYQVYVMDDFGGIDGTCAPTAATNFMYYWGNKADRKNSSLWSSSLQVFNELFDVMKTNQVVTGTNINDALPGLQKYSAAKGVKIISNYKFSAATYTKCVETIKQKGPFLLFLSNDKSPKDYGQHVVLAVGCGNNYLRILDGWSTSRSNFFDSTYLSASYDNAKGVYTTY